MLRLQPCRTIFVGTYYMLRRRCYAPLPPLGELHIGNSSRHCSITSFSAHHLPDLINSGLCSYVLISDRISWNKSSRSLSSLIIRPRSAAQRLPRILNRSVRELLVTLSANDSPNLITLFTHPVTQLPSPGYDRVSANGSVARLMVWTTLIGSQFMDHPVRWMPKLTS